MNRRHALLRWLPCIAAALVSALITLQPLTGADADGWDWPQFRGPNRDGISKETGLLTTWPQAGPKVLWRTPLGEGYSAISAVNGRLFTLYDHADDELAISLDAASGRELWRVRIDARYRDGQGNGPRATPTVADGIVYALSAQGQLWALEAQTGRKIWHQDLKRTVGARPPRWGASTSPLVEGELLILDAGGEPNASVVALDRATGELVWSTGSDKAGYSAPIAFEVNELRQVVAFTGTQIIAVRPEDGNLLWHRRWKTSYDVNAATPIFIPPDKLFVASGYDTGAVLLQLKTAGKLASAEEIWTSRGMKNQFSSSVFLDGYIYGFDNRILTAIDIRNGREMWQARGFGHGSLTYADGYLIVLGVKGNLALIEATPTGYRLETEAQVLSGKCWTVPTLSNGRLYLRNEREMVALDLRQ